MTISAQVIDTIVEWIDDNLHQPLRIDDIAAMPGIRNGICNGCFYSTKGRAWGRYIRERKLLLAARDLRDTDQRVYDICLKYGFDSQQTFTRVFTRTFNCRRAPTAKRTTVAPTEARLSWFNARGNQRRHTQRSTRYSMAPSAKNHRQNSTVELVEIHHMECLNQLLRQRQAQRRRGQQQTGEQGQQ